MLLSSRLSWLSVSFWVHVIIFWLIDRLSTTLCSGKRICFFLEENLSVFTAYIEWIVSLSDGVKVMEISNFGKCRKKDEESMNIANNFVIIWTLKLDKLWCYIRSNCQWIGVWLLVFTVTALFTALRSWMYLYVCFVMWFSDDVPCWITWCTWSRWLHQSWRLHSTSFIRQFMVHCGSQ